MKPIETIYNGYKFRSRLEARWAVFFDALGVEYEYEPEGFELGDGMYYLPDFRVKCWGTRGSIWEKPFDLWIEVKGEMTRSDERKLVKFAKKSLPNGLGYEFINPILVVNCIPNRPTEFDESLDNMNGTGIYPFNYQLIDGDYFGAMPAAHNGKFFLWGADCSYIWNEDEVLRAYDIARQARFEHGEKG